MAWNNSEKDFLIRQKPQRQKQVQQVHRITRTRVWAHHSWDLYGNWHVHGHGGVLCWFVRWTGWKERSKEEKVHVAVGGSLDHHKVHVRRILLRGDSASVDTPWCSLWGSAVFCRVPKISGRARWTGTHSGAGTKERALVVTADTCMVVVDWQCACEYRMTCHRHSSGMQSQFHFASTALLYQLVTTLHVLTFVQPGAIS